MTLARVLLVVLAVASLGLATSAAARNPDWPNGPGDDPREALPDDPGYIKKSGDKTVGGQWNLWSFMPEEWTETPGFREAEKEMGTGIHADRAWQRTTGNKAVAIAVLDSGIRWGARDIARQVMLNRGELGVLKPKQTEPPAVDDFDIDGNGFFNVQDYCVADAQWCKDNDQNGNGIFDGQDLILLASDGVDDDEDGFTDDIAGWDCYRNDNDPHDDTNFGHGTGEAHDSAAEGNNGNGGIGVCPGCALVPVRVSDSFIVETNDFACGVVFSVDYGVKVIQPALGGVNHTRYSREATEYAYEHNVAVVASAADELSFHHNTPGTQNHTLYVHATMYDADKPSRSTTFLNFNNCTNYGGQLLLSTPGTGCSSEATGVTAGHVGLIYSAALEHEGGPLDPPLSAEEVRVILVESADDIDVPESATDITKFPSGPGWDLHFGYGRNNARGSVDLVMDDRVPPEVDLVEPRWFEPIFVDRVKEVDVTGRIGLRTDGRDPRYPSYNFKLEYALGVDPKAGWQTVIEDTTEGLDGTIVSWDVEEAAKAIDFGAPLTDPHQYAVTLRLVAEADRGDGEVLRSELRKTVHLVRDPDLLEGFPVKVAGSLEASPKTADLDGDGSDEVIFCDSDGMVHAFKGSGAELEGFPVAVGFRADLDPESERSILGACAFGSGPEELCKDRHMAINPDVRQTTIAAPAVGDLDADEDLEIVVTTWDGGVFAFHHDGSAVAGFPVQVDRERAFPGFEHLEPQERPEDDEVLLDDGIMAAAVLADIDPSDESLEIVVASQDQHVYVWKADGSRMPGWPVLVQDPFSDARDRIVATPTVGDADGDGNLDIAVGTNEAFGASGAENEGRCYLLRAEGNGHPDGPVHDGWPVPAYGLQDKVLPIVGSGVPSNPVMADLDYDGDLEINCDAISGRGTFFHHDGSLAFEMDNVTFGPGSDSADSPAYLMINNGAFGRVDHEGGLDFVKGSAGFNFAMTFVAGGTRAQFDHHLCAWDTLTGRFLEQWPRKIEDWMFFMNPIIVDLDDDTLAEVVSGSGGYLVHAWNHEGEEPVGWPKMTGGWVIQSPTVGDLDGDGYYEVTVGTRHGWFYAWRTKGVVERAALEWRSYNHDNHNTGNYNLTIPIYGTRPDRPDTGPPPVVADTSGSEPDPGSGSGTDPGAVPGTDPGVDPGTEPKAPDTGPPVSDEGEAKEDECGKGEGQCGGGGGGGCSVAGPSALPSPSSGGVVLCLLALFAGLSLRRRGLHLPARRACERSRRGAS